MTDTPEKSVEHPLVVPSCDKYKDADCHKVRQKDNVQICESVVVDFWSDKCHDIPNSVSPLTLSEKEIRTPAGDVPANATADLLKPFFSLSSLVYSDQDVTKDGVIKEKCCADLDKCTSDNLCGMFAGTPMKTIEYGHSKVNVSKHEHAGEDTCVVAVRGSSNGTDWLRDFEAWQTNIKGFGCEDDGCKVHQGMLAVWEGREVDWTDRLNPAYWFNDPTEEGMKHMVEDAVSDLGCKQLVFTGHSLGGGIAQIAAYDMQSDYLAGKSTVPVKSLVTFEQPRAMNRKAAAAFELSLAGKDAIEHDRGGGKMNAIRVTNGKDYVVRVPVMNDLLPGFNVERVYNHAGYEVFQEGGDTTYCTFDAPCINKASAAITTVAAAAVAAPIALLTPGLVPLLSSALLAGGVAAIASSTCPTPCSGKYGGSNFYLGGLLDSDIAEHCTFKGPFFGSKEQPLDICSPSKFSSDWDTFDKRKMDELIATHVANADKAVKDWRQPQV